MQHLLRHHGIQRLQHKLRILRKLCLQQIRRCVRGKTVDLI